VLRRVIWLLLALPAAAILVTLAVANRHPARLVLDPFRPEAPVLSLQLPFYAWLFIALIGGVILGGLATWMTQSKWRRTARSRALDAMRWQAEADRLARERDRNVSASKAVALAGR
jgi:Mn2+/Fe2+ NRAMP family transporter